MGLTKQYLRYAPAGIFNLVGSSKPNITQLELRGAQGRYFAVGACENVIVWDVRKGEKVNSLKVFSLGNSIRFYNILRLKITMITNCIHLWFFFKIIF